MKRKSLIASILVGALALAGIGGLFAYRSVAAQAATPTATPNQPAAPADKGGRGLGGVSDSDLAAALGITTDQLTAARTTANAEALKEAVSQGLITQDEADKITQNAQNGRGFDRFGRFGGSIDYDSLLANALGIGVDKLKAAYQQVFSANLDAAVADGRITQDQADLMKAQNALAGDSKFQASMKSAYETAVNQAVTDGLITQAQADLLLKNSAGMNFGGRFGMGGMEGMHGRGGHGPRPDDAGGAPAAPNQSTPSDSSTGGL